MDTIHFKLGKSKLLASRRSWHPILNKIVAELLHKLVRDLAQIGYQIVRDIVSDLAPDEAEVMQQPFPFASWIHLSHQTI